MGDLVNCLFLVIAGPNLGGKAVWTGGEEFCWGGGGHPTAERGGDTKTGVYWKRGPGGNAQGKTRGTGEAGNAIGFVGAAGEGGGTCCAGFSGAQDDANGCFRCSGAIWHR